MKTLIKNGRIVTAVDDYRANLPAHKLLAEKENSLIADSDKDFANL